jgi:hypothetical protein
MDQLVREDRDAERAHPDILSEEEQSFPLLTECFLLEPGLVRSASVAFNDPGSAPRRAFFELLIVGREVGHVIEGRPVGRRRPLPGHPDGPGHAEP